MPHLLNAQLKALADAAHLIPVERPQELTQLIADFADTIVPEFQEARVMSRTMELDPSYLSLIDSDRVSSQTRKALLKRLGPPDEWSRKTALSTDEMKTIQALAQCVLPMADRSIDFARCIDARLVAGEGKGWGYSELPPDLTAYRGALSAIDRYTRREFRVCFAELRLEKKNQT